MTIRIKGRAFAQLRLSVPEQWRDDLRARAGAEVPGRPSAQIMTTETDACS